jgi:beta-N-acetylhexosaminidase
LDDLLRKKLLFTGLIITDELFMQAITKNYSFEQSVELAVNAGNDILLFSTNIRNNSSLVEEVINIIVKKISDGVIPLSRIEESYSRIIEIKRRYSILSSFAERTTDKLPENISLNNYPNPFNPSTTISFSVPQGVNGQSPSVQLKIFDILGGEVANLIDKQMLPGTYKVEFNASNRGENLSSGVYLCYLKVGRSTMVKKMFLIR